METMATGTQSILFLLLCSVSLSDSQDVRMPPSLIRGPTALIYYKELAKVTLYCEGVGSPAPTYKWTKNGQPLNVNTGNIHQTPGLGTIVIYPIVATDQGYYQCVLTNSFGKTMSNMTFVQMGALVGFPPYIETKTYTVDINGNICLACDDGPSVPASRIYWSYNVTGQGGGSPIEVTQTTKIQTDPFRGDLCFTHVQTEDTGKVFICSAQNAVLDRIEPGSYSRITTTGVTAPSYAPFLTFGSAAAGAVVIGLDGEAIFLRAFFSGSPIPSLIWRKNGQTPPQDRWTVTHSNTGLTLTSGRLIASDAGEYTCQGSNNMGSANHTIQLTIHARPLFVNNNFQPHDMNVTDGDVVTINCDPHAIPNASVTWFKDGVSFSAGSLPPKFSLSADSKTLNITGVCKSCYAGSAGDLMNIQCNASNEYGYAFAQGYINVLVATQITSVGGSRVWTPYVNEVFECQATSDDSTSVVRTWYFNDVVVQQGATVIFGADGSLTLLMQNETDGGQARVGQYTCDASNGFSSGQVIYTLDIGSVETAESLWWIGLIVGVILLLLLVVLLLFLFWYQRKKGASNPGNQQQVIHEEMAATIPVLHSPSPPFTYTSLNRNRPTSHTYDSIYDQHIPLQVNHERMAATIPVLHSPPPPYTYTSLNRNRPISHTYASIYVPQDVYLQPQEPLTSTMLAAALPWEQKQMLGERLFPLIQDMYPDFAAIITGMLLERDNSELLYMLESREFLKAKVEEAVAVLQGQQVKEARTNSVYV